MVSLKYAFKALFLSLLILTTMHAQSLKEGEDYIKLQTPIPNADKTLIEVFSYRCIHCYNHYRFGTLSKLKSKLPELKYELYHTNFGQGYWKQMNELFAFAQTRDNQNQIDASDPDSASYKLASAYLLSFFEKRQTFEEEKKLDAFYQIGLDSLGVSKKELDAFLKTQEYQQIMESYAIGEKIARAQGTPAFIVNGKYQILPTAFDSLEVLAIIIEDLMKLP